MTQHIAEVHDLILHKMDKGELNFESKEALKTILQEFEIHIKVIEQQLQMCQEDHAELRGEISRLVEENRDLFERLKASSHNELFRGDQAVLSDNSSVVDNLRQQLALALEEKETLEGMWKSCMKEVDDMREELHHYQCGKQLTLTQSRLNDVQQDYTEAIKILESRLSVLKMENDQLTVKTQLLEDHLIQVTSQMSLTTEKNCSLSNSLKEATSHEHEWKSRYLSLEAKYIELDRSYQADKVKFAHTYEYEKVESHLKEKLEETLQQRDELQTALERCHERMAELLRNAASDRDRIEEAVSLVEGAIQDRDEALAKEATSAEEIEKLKSKLNSLVEEAGLIVAQETAAVKKQFDSQLTALKDQLHVVEEERSRKNVEVQQLQQECERLQTLLDQNCGQGGTDKQDRQMERVYHELHFTETECLQLKMENEALRETLSKLQDRSRRNSKEKMKLKHELINLEQQSQMYQYELAVTTQRAELINAQLQQTNLEIARLQSETFMQRDNVSEAQARASAANSVELYKRVDESYGQMNEKWKNEMNALTETFEAKLKKLKGKKNFAEKEDNSRRNDKSNNH